MIVLNNHYLVNGFKQPIFLKFSHLKNNILAIVGREHTAVGVTQTLWLCPPEHIGNFRGTSEEGSSRHRQLPQTVYISNSVWTFQSLL